MKGIRLVFLSALLLAGAARAQANPWFGTWKLRLPDPAETPETLIYRDAGDGAGDGAMRMESVEAKSVIVTRFDGAPAPDVGTGGGEPRTLAVKATSPRSYSWTFAVAGTPRVQGVNTLAADGRSFTEVSWVVGKPEKTVTLVYERE
jgi:hypothetical protein